MKFAPVCTCDHHRDGGDMGGVSAVLMYTHPRDGSIPDKTVSTINHVLAQQE